MRVLLIATNQTDRYMDCMVVWPIPMGLAYVAAHIDTTQHGLHVLDCMFSADTRQEATAAVRHFQPEIVGLSLRNLDNQSYLNPVWYLPAVGDLNFGNSGETRVTVEQKLPLLRQVTPAFAALRVARRILPQTPFARQALEEGVIRGEADLLRPTFYLAAGVRAWLVDHLRNAGAAQSRWHLI